ncbi:DnaJ domain protein [Talaromyces stipitatus ATCC 10500]|uniref:DnaJ domain protein n=1 Tax=Talaromyces stipitatus (strain ATCC 10500 / CBS 375.48 / QM 6759 / NRRL 1006) TaxID=441959 RepID=B8M3M2_TALSN|nr:DnaJ domain protein [Talaromyces stipitatus ATCC 10500]EED22394.1 DnaJ domain protein [Talaromyces stipitatus ATCC 10500]
MSQDEDLAGEPPASINPYEVLDVDEKATADDIKSAYRKKALRHHPDKAAAEEKEEAKEKFQQIAFAYAILSDERRRRRYDLTGNTSESLDLEDDDFNWTEFYKEQFSGMVDVSAIEKIKKEYQNSAGERKDLLEAFEQYKGDLDRIYEVVMLSSVLEDDERFRAIIDKAIADGEVKAWKKYTEESESKRQKRLKRAQAEAEEAEEAAKELEEKGTAKKGKKSKPTKEDDNALAGLIQQRQKTRAANFFDDLEAKYAPKSAGKGKKRSAVDEPPEEAFAAVGARKSSNRGKGKRSKA